MGLHQGGWWAYLSQDENQDKNIITKELLVRVWQFARPYTGRLLLLLLGIMLATGISLVSPLLMRALFDNAIPNGNLRLLNWLALGLILVPVINGLLGVWQRGISAFVGEGIIFDLRNAVYSHFQQMSIRFFTQSRTGELMSRLNNDVVGAQQAVSSTLITIFSNIVQVIATLVIMIALEWRLTLLGLIVMPLIYLPARKIGAVLRDIRRESMVLNAEMNATMNETLNISGALLIKLFGRQQSELTRFRKDSAAVRDLGVRSAIVARWFMMILGIIGALGTAMVYWAGGFLTIREAFTIGTIVAFGSYLAQLYGPLMALTNAPIEFVQSLVSFERVFEVLDIPVEIAEQPNATKLTEVEGTITFEDVSFDYTAIPEGYSAGLTEVVRYTWGDNKAMVRRGRPPRTVAYTDEKKDKSKEKPTEETTEPRWALNQVSFRIEPGKLVALVGPSGAGKTTITYLIPRLYDPTEGRVLLDGHELKSLSLESIAEAIGMVSQETYLFYDTIRANLLYAKPGATEEEMLAATTAANIHDFIMSLPDQYDTVVGERGYRLSGGERQRVAIARVLLKDPRILVLDEATSHLDSLSEALIQDALQHVMKGRTSLVIAHRLSTILAADTILVMNQGNLVESGTHQELLAQGGLYASLYETQFKSDRILDAV